MQIKISVVICTLNEEKNIERCITAALPVADEIIVVDSGSTDKTIEISQKLGARVVIHSFEGFGQQKQWADNQASYNYILSLDADEVLSDELKNNILDVKDNCQADGYILTRLTNYCGSWIYHGGWYPDKKLRLYDRNKGGWNLSEIHEQVEMKQRAVVKDLRGDLFHYSYTSINQHINRLEKYTFLKAQHKFKNGKKSSLVHIIFSPAVKFLKQYFFQGGFRDGYHGFIIAKISAFGQFLTYARLYDIAHRQKNNK